MRGSTNVARLGLLVGFAAGIFGYFGLATIWGETDSAKGGAFIIAGATLMIYDIAYRWFNNRHAGVGRFWDSDAGPSVAGVPGWGVGCTAIVGGIALMVEAARF
jgi:hypothetical protein